LRLICEVVCSSCGTRRDWKPGDEVGQCPKCKGYAYVDCVSQMREVRFQYQYPASKNLDWVIACCMDAQYYDHALTDFAEAVWKQYKNNMDAEEIAKLLDTDVAAVERAFEMIGVR